MIKGKLIKLGVYYKHRFFRRQVPSSGAVKRGARTDTTSWRAPSSQAIEFVTITSRPNLGNHQLG